MNFTGGEVQRRNDVIGDAFLAQVPQYRKVHQTIRIGDAAPQRGPDLADTGHRAIAKRVALEQFEAAFGDDRSAIRPPHEAAADDLRMQCPYEHHGAP